jgi:hypothetical protein
MFATRLNGDPVQQTPPAAIDTAQTAAPVTHPPRVPSAASGAAGLQHRTRGADKPARVRRDTEPATRVPRGGTLRKCADDSPFRECRGGEGLRSTAWSYVPFDQIRYVGEPHIGGRGSCEGWAR